LSEVKAPSQESLLDPGRNCWRIEHADRAAVIIDASDYFRLARKAMLAAEEQVLLIGWDFDTRITLKTGEHPDDAPITLGPFISWIARRNPALQIHILKWDVGALKLLGRGSTILRLFRWMRHKQVHFKLDGAHPAGASHHQKMIVIDDRLAFCGGIDMTGSRWDTRAHADHDQRRRRPFTRRYYGPWHDASMAVEGDAARALGELARARWEAASGDRLPSPSGESDPWPETLSATFEDIQVGISRTRGETEARKEIREIEALFVDLIRAARKFIYAETQFFASRVIAEEIAKRLAEEDGPEFVIINPVEADTWLEESVMGPARAELLKALDPKDPHGRFRIYTPVTDGGEHIYVHAKIMIVDDFILRVGSANMNNRSMGLDSECDLVIDGRVNSKVTPAIAALRSELMAEHLGKNPSEVQTEFASTGSLIAAIENLRGSGRTLAPFEPPEWDALRKAIAKTEALDPEHPEEILETGSAKLVDKLDRNSVSRSKD
jgi:phospholipase D1/2